MTDELDHLDWSGVLIRIKIFFTNVSVLKKKFSGLPFLISHTRIICDVRQILAYSLVISLFDY